MAAFCSCRLFQKSQQFCQHLPGQIAASPVK
ncbi:MAG: SWIM zinc finger family protein [Hungatella sp.]